jgi:hypothetical protein
MIQGAFPELSFGETFACDFVFASMTLPVMGTWKVRHSMK